MSTEEIAGRLGMSDRTIRDWLKQETFPEAQKRRKRQSSFDPFVVYVLKRWQNGEHNGLALWREIKARGGLYGNGEERLPSPGRLPMTQCGQPPGSR